MPLGLATFLIKICILKCGTGDIEEEDVGDLEYSGHKAKMVDAFEVIQNFP